MCFSSAASFGAAIVLGATGIACMSRARTAPQRVLAGIPLVFALQQFTEGILWLSLLQAEWAQWKDGTTHGFLVFAQAVWPVYIPLAMYLFEQNSSRKKLIGVLAGAGVIFSAYAIFCLFYYPVSAIAEQHHIRYQLGYSLSQKWYYGLLYFIPTIVAPLMTSERILHWLGWLFLASYIVARLLFHFYVISVWCFFGAIISFVILAMILRLNRRRLS
jgi:hypothetical protein